MNREKLLHEIMKVDFALLDLKLFLNTHPNDIEALNNFNNLANESNVLKKDFETKFGPLSSTSNSSCDKRYDWIDTPWPWQNYLSGGQK